MPNAPLQPSPDTPRIHARLPLGVFDSGVGGLTVLRALRRELPQESFLYLGDTARLPYGTKSPASVLRYSIQAAQFLIRSGIKCLVVACNTASSFAVDELRRRFAPVIVVGVLEPGAAAGCAATRSGRIAVLATEATVSGGAYQAAIARLAPQVRVTAQACSLFVALAEEGWTRGEIATAIARRYLDAVLARDPLIDTLLLGCTHFPVLVETLREVVGPSVCIVDSAQTTAAVVRARLSERGLLAPGGDNELRLLATDGAERFARIGSRFLAEPFAARQVELVDLAPAGGIGSTGETDAVTGCMGIAALNERG
ncbi:glutamate racemase [Steroidobacter denitrificans]|uniref:glutamate racemase n=1 Tax=Steroidobacter denitrificans TaxID=465721 RepID=UPI0009FB8895|nr:glutamate racemase [Steroidobacter denitrificans]